MKELYQSKNVRSKVINKNIEQNTSQVSSGQKSAEKHLLKPSNVPSFSKVSKNKK
jgi:hypothetical protein